jgi:hypothetical protein
LGTKTQKEGGRKMSKGPWKKKRRERPMPPGTEIVIQTYNGKEWEDVCWLSDKARVVFRTKDVK